MNLTFIWSRVSEAIEYPDIIREGDKVCDITIVITLRWQFYVEKKEAGKKKTS